MTGSGFACGARTGPGIASPPESQGASASRLGTTRLIDNAGILLGEVQRET